MDNRGGGAGDLDAGLDGGQVLTGNESPTPSDGAVYFPELQGLWSRDCEYYDPDELGDGYSLSRITITGNAFKTNTSIYSDSNCLTLLERGFLQAGISFQTAGILSRADGSADTSVGSVPFFDFTTQENTIDEEPVIASLANLFAVETAYEIVYVDGRAFYLGINSEALDGSSPETRSTALDFEHPYNRR